MGRSARRIRATAHGGRAAGGRERPAVQRGGFQIGLWIITVALGSAFVAWHAWRVRRGLSLSSIREIGDRVLVAGLHVQEGAAAFTGRQKLVLAVFAVRLAVLVADVLVPDGTSLSSPPCS